jgi:hypothetical protein
LTCFGQRPSGKWDAERLIAVLRRARRVYKDLRNLEEYEGVKIRFPEEFLRELGEAQ